MKILLNVSRETLYDDVIRETSPEAKNYNLKPNYNLSRTKFLSKINDH